MQQLIIDERTEHKVIPATMGTHGQQLLNVKHTFLSHLERLLKGKSSWTKIYLISSFLWRYEQFTNRLFFTLHSAGFFNIV